MRTWILRLHLWIALPAALFLLVLGLSGAVIAFENDYDRWLNSHLWNVTPGSHRVSQQALLDTVLARVAPARVDAIFMQDRRPDAAERYAVRGGKEVFADPYTGAVLGVRDHAPPLDAVPRDEQDSWDLEKRAPDDRSATVHGTVYVNQYTGGRS
jgi:uncharacterized iron-regulated membrane protein